MKLTESEILALKNVILKKGVKYVDVQMEILDHLASLVEDLMNANPDLTFEDAIKQANASFGIFGIGTLETSISSGINSKYRGVFWKQFLSFFKLRYIGLIVLLSVLFYRAQLVINDLDKVMVGFLLITFITCGWLIIINFRLKKTKSFLSQTTSMSYLKNTSLFYLCLHYFLDLVALPNTYGIDLNYALISSTLVVYFLYIISSVKTASYGIRESEELARKYKQLNW